MVQTVAITDGHERWPLGSLHHYVSARTGLSNQCTQLHRANVIRALPNHVGHIAAGNGDELLDQWVASQQTIVQPRQHVSPESSRIPTEQTQPAIGRSTHIQYINLGKTVRRARIRQQAAHSVVRLAS
jgi:hypothetical protein